MGGVSKFWKNEILITVRYEINWNFRDFLNWGDPLILSHFRYYSKQIRDDKLKQRRARVAEERKKEEQERLQHFGLINGKLSHIS